MMQSVRFEYGRVLFACDLECCMIEPFFDHDREEGKPHGVGVEYASASSAQRLRRNDRGDHAACYPRRRGNR